MRKSLTREERLRGRTALKGVFSSPKRADCPGARLLFAENGLSHNRIVVSPARKFGTAVARNRARRVGKEAYRQMQGKLKPGFDLAFILFPGDYSYGDRISQFSFLLRKAGILQKE